jgi:hypothetical protein
MSIVNENKKLECSLETLEINLDEVGSITKDYLKKKYHKLCLKWHPDKNTECVIESTKKFQEINDSYVYLMKNLFDENSNTFSEYDKETKNVDNSLYRVMLVAFLRLVINGEYLLNVVQEIILNSNLLTASIFENIDVRTAIDLYNLLCKYRDIFHISNDVLYYISLLIKEKYKNDKIIILRASLDDLWQNNIYKLNYNGEYYLIPLWHNELYFDKNNIIVLCNPMLPEEVSIDENNNIIMDVKINIKTELSELMKENENYKIVSIGCQNFAIPLNKLLLKKCQIYKFKGQGISQIIENDIYNTGNKSDVIMRIYLI